MRTFFCAACVACFVCFMYCLSAAPVVRVHAGEELMPLAANVDAPVRVNVVNLVIPSPAKHFTASDPVEIPGLSTPDIALVDKRAREAARAAALEPPKPFATRPDRASKSRPERIHLPPPIAGESEFAFPGFSAVPVKGVEGF